jgi:hypothetical protein
LVLPDNLHHKLQEKGALKRSCAPPTVETRVIPTVLKIAPKSWVIHTEELLHHGFKTAVHVGAVICVAEAASNSMR